MSFEGDSDSLFELEIRPWLREQSRERDWLQGFRVSDAQGTPPCSLEDSWRLYALSRIVDLVRLPLTPTRLLQLDSWSVFGITDEDLREFFMGFGLDPLPKSDFHPFFHEIVEVDQDPDPDAPAVLLGEVWPGAALGTLLISRAGVRIRAGKNVVDKEIAENSVMHWAFARNNRSELDLSEGWGHNSQWRTRFRRDYFTGAAFYYNVDAEPDDVDLDDDDPEPLTESERLELLRHRCFVTCSKPDDDLWPWDDKWVEDL